ncbi:armadillo-type protein [Xylariaceae sp. FL0016]|nr:armadillo-type protein [Xylariaceae sp. FL0016]
MVNGFDTLFASLPDDAAVRTDALRRCVASLTTQSPSLDEFASKAADAARDESWRTPIGVSGLLAFFCGLITDSNSNEALVVHTLRVIGNSCADVDENRERVVASGCLPNIVNLLNSAHNLLAFAVPVLFNICVDYEPAQKAIYKAGVNPELVSLISSSRLADAEPFMSYICKLLSFVAKEEPEANWVHPATPFVLLSLATKADVSVDVEDFLGQTSVALTYLSQEQFQKTFLETPGSVDLVLQAFSKACGGLDASQLDTDDQAQLKQVQTAFTATLADLSAHPLFASSCPLDGPQAQELQRWLFTPYSPLQTTACLSLGNIARSDETCTFLVQQSQIHKPLVAILADESKTDAGLLHSVLSFLKNLAIAIPNKATIGDAGALDNSVIPRMWEIDTQPQVQFDATSLTRLLLLYCPANVRRIISPLSADPGSPAHERTKVHLLMDLFKRTDNEPTKMETARCITTVCRVIHTSQSAVFSPTISASASTPAPDSTPSTEPLQTFYERHSGLTNIMVHLGTQTKFPVLRSELLFVFALMARTDEGARAVAWCMRPFTASFVCEAVTGEKLLDFETEDGEHPRLLEPSDASPPAPHDEDRKSASLDDDTPMGGLGLHLEAQPPSQPQPASAALNTAMPNVDRDNGMVLVAQILQRCPGDLPPLPRRTFRRILKQGGEQLLQDRDADADAREEREWDQEFREATEALSGPGLSIN